MAISVKHAFQSAKADGPDSTLVQPSNWNAEHTITADAGKVLGRDTSGAGAVQELPIAVDVSGNVALGGALSVDGNTTLGNASTDSVTVNAGTVSIPNNVNFSGGNVGIGTSSPGAKLDVNGYARVSAAAGLAYTFDVFSNGQTTNQVSLGQGQGSATDNVGFLYNRANAAFAFGTNNLERMRIDSAGNVGIGTSSVASGYRIESTGSVKLTSDYGVYAMTTTNGRGWRMGNTSNGTNLGYFYIQGTTDNWSSSFVDGLFISSAGNVGIGTSAPGVKLDVVGASRASTNYLTQGSALYLNAAQSTGGWKQEIIFSSQGTASKWSVGPDMGNTGDNNFFFYSHTSSAFHLVIESNGTLTSLPTYNNTAAGSTVVVTSTGLIRRTSSSIKYKKDVESLDPALATNAIEGLRPVWYRTKNAEGDDKATWSHIGLIAEEVHEVEPRLVRYRTAEVIQEQKPVLDEAGEPVLDEEGNPTFTTERVERELAVPEPEDVDYARLSVLLLAEVQSLRARVAALEAA